MRSMTCRNRHSFVALLYLVLLGSCGASRERARVSAAPPVAAPAGADGGAAFDAGADAHDVPEPDLLSEQLAAGDWKALDEVKRRGEGARPTLRTFSLSKSVQARRLAIDGLASIGHAGDADVIGAALSDVSINVRLAAARALGERTYPGATDMLLGAIASAPESVLLELFIRAAGLHPSARTVAAIRPFAKGEDVGSNRRAHVLAKDELAADAIYALAKLGDAGGIKALTARLGASLPYTRYHALERLCYVADRRFVPLAVRALSDRSRVFQLGFIAAAPSPDPNPQYRRVCDQAVEASLCLTGVRPPFQGVSGRVYSDGEIAAVRKLAR